MKPRTTSRKKTSGSSRDSYESHFEHTALFEFSKVINSSSDLKFVLSHILLTIMGKLLSSKGMALLACGKGQFCAEMVKGFLSELAGRQFSIKSITPTLLFIDRLSPARHPWAKELRKAGVRFVLPLFVAERPIGLLCFGDRLSKKRLTEKETTYLRSLANISATAIEKNRSIEEMQVLNRRLDGKVQELNTLFELGKEFSVVLDPDKLIRLLVFSILGQIGVSRYLVCLSKGPDMIVVSSRVDGAVPQGEFLCGLKIKNASLISDVASKRGAAAVEPLAALGIAVVVPMQIQGETRGLICLGEKLSREPYLQADMDLLSSLGNLAIISLENARLFKEALEKQKLEDELQIAREIQKGLLPSVLPAIPFFDIAATNISSKQVGGDYYDAITTSESMYVIAIGDVSGKGTPAALLMANLQATIRALVPLRISLSELTARVNDLMCHNTGADKFITFFWGFLDPSSLTLTYVNAGHNYPFLIRGDGMTVRLESGGMILGIVPTMTPYEQGSITLRPDDVLVLFTDGVSEAMSKTSQEYSEERLEVFIHDHRHLSAQSLIDALHQDILQFTRGAVQSDDITLMVLKALQPV